MSKDFITITNREIYSKLVEIERKIETIRTKENVNRWMAGTALSLTLGIIIGGFI